MATKTTISQRLAVTGTEEIERALAVMGQAGERAFAAIAAAAEKASPGITGKFEQAIARVQAGFARLREAGSRVGIAMQGVRVRFASFTSSLATVGARLGLVTAAAITFGGALLLIGKQAVQAVDDADELAQSLGLSIEKYSGLAGVAGEAGVDAAAFSTALTRLNVAIAETAEASGRAAIEVVKVGDAEVTVRRGIELVTDAAKDGASVFAKLGIATRDATGEMRSADKVLLDIADVFAKMPDGPKEAALAVELFGKAGAKLIPFLNLGSAGILALTEDAKKMGTVLTEQDSKVAALADRGLNRMSNAIKGARIQLGLLFAPAITQGSNFIADTIRENMGVLKAFTEVVIVAGKVLVTDLLALLAGEDDRVTFKWLVTARDFVVSFSETVKNAVTGIIVPAFEALHAGAELAAGAINSFFGTDFTGAELLVSAAILKLVGGFKVLSAAIMVGVASLNLLLSVLAVLPAGFLGIGAGILAVVAAGIVLAETLHRLTGLARDLAYLAVFGPLGGAGTVVFVFWDEFKARAEAAFGTVKGWATEARDFIVNQFSDPSSFTREAFAAWLESWRSLFGGIEGLARGLAGILETVVVGAINSVIASIKEAIGFANSLLGTAETAPSSGGGGGGGGGAGRGGGAASPIFNIMVAIRDPGFAPRLAQGLMPQIPSFNVPRLTADHGAGVASSGGGDTLVLDLGGKLVPLKGERGAVAEIARYLRHRHGLSIGSTPHS